MGDRGQRAYDDRSKQEEVPPHSRLFVVCSKKHKEEDLREPFEKLGTIENIFIPRDRASGESKGVAYIKFAKTSSAAAAIRDYHLKTVNSESRPMKVMIACNRNDSNGASNISVDKLKRLFIMVSKTAKDLDIREHFSQFGAVDSVFIQKDRNTQENRGFAYVTFETFYDAAKAFEECDPKYKPVFATPKDELKRGRNSNNTDYNSDMSGGNYNNYNDSYGFPQDRPVGGTFSNMTRKRNDNNKVRVTVSPQLPSKYIEMLFNIIPGMENFQYSNDNYQGVSKVIVTYQDSGSADHAVDRLNNFTFPSGEMVCVEPETNPMMQAASNLKSIVDTFKNAVESGNGPGDLAHLAEAIAQASSFIKVATVGGIADNRSDDSSYCSVKLPLPQPLAENTRCAQRCFIVCKPKPPPMTVLKDVFRRFGDLIDIIGYPNKNYVFAKYASVRAAQDAINMLHGATVCGAVLKVMEADERTKDDSKRMKMNVDDVSVDDDATI